MDIGEPKRTWEVEPPEQTPVPQAEPSPEPIKEPVGVPA